MQPRNRRNRGMRDGWRRLAIYRYGYHNRPKRVNYATTPTRLPAWALSGRSDRMHTVRARGPQWLTVCQVAPMVPHLIPSVWLYASNS
jgi:hypothetical protein